MSRLPSSAEVGSLTVADLTVGDDCLGSVIMSCEHGLEY